MERNIAGTPCKKMKRWP